MTLDSFQWMLHFHAVIESLSSSCRVKTQWLKQKKTIIFTCCFLWMWNRVFHVKRRTQIEGVERKGWWGEYLDVRGIKWQEAGENCIMRRSVILYSSPDIVMIKSRRVWWAGHMWGHEKFIQNLRSKTWRRRPLGRPRCSWNIILKKLLGK
jgi:hypothetical protein